MQSSTIYTVAFLKEGYISEMNQEQFDKIKDKLGKYVKVINITGWSVILSDSRKTSEPKKPFYNMYEAFYGKGLKRLLDKSKIDISKITFTTNKDMQTNTMWLIWSTEHKGWWKPNHMGYTQDLSEAGVYEYQEAVNIVHGANIGLLHSNTAIPNESMILLQGELKEKYFSTKIKP